MSLLHLSIPAQDPETVSRVLATILDGTALPFPPCPGAWIAFSHRDDGTAIEVYPAEVTVVAGAETISFLPGAKRSGASATHVAIASVQSAEDVLAIGQSLGWRSRRCNRGPFECIEIWVENLILVEVLDPEMLEDYRRNMTVANWRGMFGLEGEQ